MRPEGHPQGRRRLSLAVAGKNQDPVLLHSSDSTSFLHHRASDAISVLPHLQDRHDSPAHREESRRGDDRRHEHQAVRRKDVPARERHDRIADLGQVYGPSPALHDAPETDPQRPG